MEEGGGGVLFEQGNVDDLTEKLTALLTDREAIRRLGQAGRTGAMEKFTAAAAAAGLAELFDDVTQVTR